MCVLDLRCIGISRLASRKPASPPVSLQCLHEHKTKKVTLLHPISEFEKAHSKAESMSNSILVTGGAGFIGSNFVLQWIENVATPLVNLDLLTYAGNPANLATLEDDSDRKSVV